MVEEMQEKGKTTTERGDTFSTQHHDGRHMGWQFTDHGLWQSAGHGSWRPSCLALTFSSNFVDFLATVSFLPFFHRFP